MKNLTFSRILSQSACLGAFFLIATATRGQEYYALSLAHEGSASVAISRDIRRAYITDGGKRGLGGMPGAHIEGQDILAFLKSQDIKDLVITCSHPHADHMGGLLDAVRDSRILTFERLYFVDSGFRTESGVGSQSLQEAYLNHWNNERLKAAGAKGAPPSERIDAAKRNAFAEISKPEHSVHVRNFVYEPAPGSNHPHGRTVFTEFTLRTGDKVVRILDPDDADSDVIKKWCDAKILDIEAKRLPQDWHIDLLLGPHHGSDKTSLKPLLDERFGVRSVAFNTSPNNRYFHPGPTNALAAIEAVGAKNVHFTGVGVPLKITPMGIESGNGGLTSRELYLRFLDGPVTEAQRKLTEYEAKIALAPDRSEHARGRLGELRQEAQAALELKRRMLESADAVVSPRPDKSLTDGTGEFKVRANELSEALAESKPGQPVYQPESTPSAGEIETNTGGGSGGGVGGGGNSQSAPEKGQSASARSSEPRGGSAPNTSRSASASGRQSLNVHSSSPNSTIGQSRTSMRSPAITRSGGGSIPRPRFAGSMRIRPIFGGVILGNSPAEAPSNVCCPQFEVDGSFSRITLTWGDDGQLYVFDDLTTSELWSAYQFVQPDQHMRNTHEIVEDECSLVGLSEPFRSYSSGEVWKFDIHPAVANTLTAMDLMQTDMLLSDSSPRWVKSLLEAHQPSGIVLSYQWFDEQSIIEFKDGRVHVNPASEPLATILRVRFWHASLPKSLDETIGELIAETEKRLREEAKKAGLDKSTAFQAWLLQNQAALLLSDISLSEVRVGETSQADMLRDWSNRISSYMRHVDDQELSLRNHPAVVEVKAEILAYKTAVEEAKTLKPPTWLNSTMGSLGDCLSSRAFELTITPELTNESKQHPYTQIAEREEASFWDDSEKADKEMQQWAESNDLSDDQEYRFWVLKRNIERQLAAEEFGESSTVAGKLAAECYWQARPLQRLDRFARGVALLNWIKSWNGELPPLPEGIQAPSIRVPPFWFSGDLPE